MGSGFCIIKFQTLHSAVLESTLNGKSRNINLEDIHLTNAVDMLETENSAIKIGGEKHNSFYKWIIARLYMVGIAVTEQMQHSQVHLFDLLDDVYK